MDENVHNFNFELAHSLCVQTQSAKNNWSVLHGEKRDKNENSC